MNDDGRSTHCLLVLCEAQAYFNRIALVSKVQCCSERRTLPKFYSHYILGEAKLSQTILIALSGIRGFTRGPNVSPALE